MAEDSETQTIDLDDSSAASSRPPKVPSKKRNATTSTSSSRPLAEVWEHYIKDESSTKENPKCFCKYCNTPFACHTKRNGTSSMKYHLTKFLEYPANKDLNQKKLSFAKRDSESSTNLVAWKFDKDVCRGKLARMIIIDEFPFSFVEGEGFRDFCYNMCPNFEPVSRRTICRDVVKLYEEQKSSLKEMFAKSSFSVCLTTDTWTSIQNINYMALTAHFVDDDWKLHKRILIFCVITNHRGLSIGKLICTCIKEWGIKKVLTITVDNASANDTAVKYMKEALSQENDMKLVLLGGEYMHVRCCTHILNLIVNDGLKDIHSAVVSIRNVVRYVRSSPSRLHKFKEFIKRLKIESKTMLALDLPTRWNSTYLMLEAALKYRKVFELMEEEDGHYLAYFNEDDGGKRKSGPPRALDWEKAKVFVQFFRTFYEVTLKFSCTLSVTSNTCFTDLIGVEEQIKGLSKEQDPLLSTMTSSMKLKYDKY